MATTDDQRSLDDAVLNWLDTSGRALEMRVSRTIRRTGATVLDSYPYVDKMTGAVRETDVLARFYWVVPGPQNIMASIHAVIECKDSQAKPWVAFYSGELDHSRSPDLAQWSVFAHGPFTNVTDPLAALWIGKPPFDSTETATHAVAALTAEGGKDHAYDAVRQALSGAEAARERYLEEQSTRPRGEVVIPVVVTTAPLFACRLDAYGDTHLQRVRHFDVWGHAKDGQRRRVYVRSEESLSQFAIDLASRASDAGK